MTSKIYLYDLCQKALEIFINYIYIVRVEGMDEARTQMQEVKRELLITMINKTNKNYPVGEKQTGHKT